ncbi:MAG: ABC transporter substrate-binding protein [Oscillospiraceae bacterium]|nr:ABC transporter substrate-binding protein [Oscillospiraceae bacterium]
MKKLLSLLLSGALACSLLAACGGNGGTPATNPPATNPGTAAPAGSNAPAGDGDSLDGTTIKIGATPAPHVEILEVVRDLLAEEGITLDIVEFNDYILPNTAVEDGSLDANYFQHITYMNDFNTENGTHLAAVADVHYEPFGLYAGKTASLDALADGAKIAVPNDTTNEARALLLLEQEGLITLKEGAGITATKADIAENPKNLDIVELEASQVPSRLADVDLAVINGNYALGAGLKVSDALAVESADGAAATAYVNVLTVKEGKENDPAIQALVRALLSDEVKEFITNTYEGAVVAVF